MWAFLLLPNLLALAIVNLIQNLFVSFMAFHVKLWLVKVLV